MTACLSLDLRTVSFIMTLLSDIQPEQVLIIIMACVLIKY